MIAVLIFMLLTSYILCIAYVKVKMKAEAEAILKRIKDKVDQRNLDNLVKLSEKKRNPEGYNKNIVQYQDEIALYTGMRALSSPKETFEDFFALLVKLLTF